VGLACEGVVDGDGIVQKRVRREDVARAAGVSGATVSYVLNGRAEEMRLSAATAVRVRQVADELGYVPHGAARDLRRGRTDRIALVLWLAHRPYWVPMLEAMHHQAKARGFQVVVAFRDRDEPLREVVLPLLAQTDGAIVIAGALHDEDVAACDGASKPLLFVNHWPLPGFRVVVTPGGELIGLATGHLLDQGWDEVVLGSRLPHFVEGFQAALAERGRELDPSLLRAFGNQYQSGRELAQELGESVRGKAVAMPADAAAIGAIAVFEQFGLRAGRDYGITGLHNHDAGAWLTVPLTTAHRRYELVIETALNSLFSGDDEIPAIVPSALIIRESSLKPAI